MKRQLRNLLGLVIAAFVAIGLIMPQAAEAQTTGFSASPGFTAALQVDLNIINLARPCVTSIVPTAAQLIKQQFFCKFGETSLVA
jgi:hypothetical protein